MIPKEHENRTRTPTRPVSHEARCPDIRIFHKGTSKRNGEATYKSLSEGFVITMFRLSISSTQEYVSECVVHASVMCLLR